MMVETMIELEIDNGYLSFIPESGADVPDLSDWLESMSPEDLMVGTWRIKIPVRIDAWGDDGPVLRPGVDQCTGLEELRDELSDIGLTLLTEVETDEFVTEMRERSASIPKEPAVLPPAPIDYIPSGLWDDEESDMLRLLTQEQYAALPDGVYLVSVNGHYLPKGDAGISLDTRYGHIAWGFRESQLTKVGR